MATAMTIRAVYRDGVLRPEQPLPLAEGEVIDVTIAWPAMSGPMRAATPEEAAYLQRVKATRSLQELHAAMATAPPDDSADIVEAINESRRATGFRLPDPTNGEEMTQ